MINANNTFKKAVDDLAKPTDPILASPDKELDEREKARLLYQTKMYIQLESIVSNLESELKENEEIVGYMPFTNQANSSIGTFGLMGMTYTKTAEAQNYRDTFQDLRGNRMLVFTNERIMFMVIIEYLEEGLFYSYPYEAIQGIRLEKHLLKYFDWSMRGRNFLPPRGQSSWYTLDFQADEHVFTELLTVQDYARFEDLVAQIPPLQKMTIDEKVHRKNKFDYLFSNVKLAQQVFIGFWIILIIAVVLFYIYQFATNPDFFSGISQSIGNRTLAFTEIMSYF